MKNSHKEYFKTITQRLTEIHHAYICRIPSDHIPIRSWPLFLARELMRDLIETLKAEQST